MSRPARAVSGPDASEASDERLRRAERHGLRLATFNSPLEIADPEQAALAAAKALTAASASGGFTVRVGLAAGAVAAGSVGSSNRQAFTVYGDTVYGDTVNRAARLEALAKDAGEAILLDEAITQATHDRDSLRSLGPKATKGLAAPITVWAVPI